MHKCRIALVVLVGRSDKRKVLLIGNDEEDALVFVLENIAFRMIVEFGHDDVAALNQPDGVRGCCYA